MIVEQVSGCAWTECPNGVEYALKDTPSVDKERVARLRQAVADGTYAPDNARVAAKLLKFEAEN